MTAAMAATAQRAAIRKNPQGADKSREERPVDGLLARTRSSFVQVRLVELTFVVDAVDGGGLAFAVLMALSAAVRLVPGGLPPEPVGRDDRAAFCIPVGFRGSIAGRPRGHGRAAEHFYRELAVRSQTGVVTEAVTGTATGALPPGARVMAAAGWKAVTQ